MIAFFRFFLAGIFLTSSFNAILPIQPRGVPQLEINKSNQIKVSETSEGIQLSLAVQDYYWRASEQGLALVVPNADNLNIPNQPVSPVFSTLVAIPADAEFRYSILEKSEITIVPSQSMALFDNTNQDAFSDSAPELIEENFQCEKNQIIQSIEVSEPIWIRDQRAVRIIFHPFRWDCQLEVWSHAPILEVHLEFDRPGFSAGVTQSNLSSPVFDAALKNTLVNYEDGLAWRGFLQDKQNQFIDTIIPQAKEGGSEKVRIEITNQGVYRILASELITAGLDLSNWDPAFMLLENQGRTVSIDFEGDDDSLFEDGESILFYGEQFDGTYLASLYPDQDDHWATFRNGFQPQFNAEMVEKYTDDNVYWLFNGFTSSGRISEFSQGNSDYLEIASNEKSDLFEQDRRWWTDHFTSEETWFWEQNISVYSALVEKSYSFALQDALLDPQLTATLELQLTSNSASVPNPDHRLEVYLNNHFLSQESWDGAVWHTFSLPLSQDLLVNGDNTLKIRFIPIAGVVANRYAFDQFSLKFTRQLNAHAGSIEFSQPAGDWTFHINGFSTEPPRIWDINNPLEPVELQDYLFEEGIFTFSNSQPTNRDYVLFGPEAILTPEITKVTFGDLYDTQNGSDYLIITVPEFEDALQPLIDWRNQQGLSVKVVDIQDIYNQFNFGIPHPIAIKNFLRYTTQYWDVVPTYVVLVGDGHWDLKNYQVPAPNQIPPNFVWVDPVQGEIDSLSDLAAVVGNDILPDFLIGRIPVNNLDEVSAVVSKAIAFEQSQGEWLDTLAFSADNYFLDDGCVDNDPSTLCTTEPAGNFPALMDAFILDFVRHPYTYDKFYLDDYNCRSRKPDNCNLVTDALVNDINSSPAQIYTYTGHGAITGWASEKIFNIEDLPRLTNVVNFPIFFSLDCVDGFYYYPPGIANPDPIALAELIVRMPDAGASAMYSATGFSYSSAHDVLQRGFFEYFFRNHNPVLGAADLSAKLKVYATGANDEMIFTYMIFGDPALRMHNELQFIYMPMLGR